MEQRVRKQQMRAESRACDVQRRRETRGEEENEWVADRQEDGRMDEQTRQRTRTSIHFS